MKPVNILLFTGMWKRYAVSELFAQSIKRFIADAPAHFSVKVFAVVSDQTSALICKQHNFYYVMHENNPLGKKFNFGVRCCVNLPFDYLLLTGDDDLWNSEAWSHYSKPIEEKKDYFGFRECYFYSTKGKEALGFRYPQLSGKVLGCGRMIRRSVLDQADWKLWDDEKDNRLDGSCDTRLAAYGIHPVQLLTDSPMVLDVKSGTNIWSFDHLKKYSYSVDVNEALSFLPQTEIESLNKL